MGISVITKMINRGNFRSFSRFVEANHSRMQSRVFSRHFCTLKREFLQNGEIEEFCNASTELANHMMEVNRKDFAGIIMSSLCKINNLTAAQLEVCAKKGYEFAKKNNDYIHMLSRLEDLKRIYEGRPERFYDYLHTLYREEKTLKHIVQKYETDILAYSTIDRCAKEKETYEKMLAHLQIDISKLTLRKEPGHTKNRLLSAKAICEKYNYFKSIDYINFQLEKISHIISA